MTAATMPAQVADRIRVLRVTTVLLERHAHALADVEVTVTAYSTGNTDMQICGRDGHAVAAAEAVCRFAAATGSTATWRSYDDNTLSVRTTATLAGTGLDAWTSIPAFGPLASCSTCQGTGWTGPDSDANPAIGFEDGCLHCEGTGLDHDKITARLAELDALHAVEVEL